MRWLFALFVLGALWAGPAQAAPCPLPYILQNGTIPDAVQVMADFYALQNCIQSGTGGGGGGPPPADIDITSIAISVPVELNITPVAACTGPTCTFVIGKAVEAANTFWAGPTSGAPAIPTFRGLVASDISSCAILPGGGCPVDLAVFYPGAPPASAIVRIAIDRALSCSTLFAGSVGNSRQSATAQTVVNINQVTAGVSTNIGTATFAAAASTATFSTGGAIAFNPGDDVEVAFPAVPDTTLGDVAITLQCARG